MVGFYGRGRYGSGPGCGWGPGVGFGRRFAGGGWCWWPRHPWCGGGGGWGPGGWWGGPYGPGPYWEEAPYESPQAEMADLKELAASLREDLEAIETRLAQLEGQAAGQ